MPLETLIAEATALEEGGTLAVFLAGHALRRGYQATIYTYNLHVFDPSWFSGPVDLAAKLRGQLAVKSDPKLRIATEGYLDFLGLGGKVRFRDLTPRLVRSFLLRGRPILAGLSATYLYHGKREFGQNCDEDDVRGLPVGHFVVLCGYDREKREALVADPLLPNPLAKDHVYAVDMERLMGAILLGVITYDANLLIIEPRGWRGPGEGN
jgi:hypothetical protein